MIKTLKDGSIKYEQSDFLKSFFEEKVRNPFDEHQKTEPWKNEVLDSYSNGTYKKIKNIIGGGQGEFDEPFNGLTPQEKVLVYCFDNMQQHVVSSLYIFKKHTNLFERYLFECNKKPVFIDFGCGPLTSGIAFARYFSESKRSNGQNLNFHYIGIDRSEAMLQKAGQFILYPCLFHQDTTFNFCKKNDNESLLPTLISFLENYVSPNALIILNFSYFFASPSLEVKGLITSINQLLQQYRSNKICVIFQNPQGDCFNKKWQDFIEGLQEVETIINGPIKENFYYDDSLTRCNNRETKLYYDICFSK